MIQQLHILITYACVLLLSSCLHTKLEKQSTKALEGLPQYWLTSSLYAGPCPYDKHLILLDSAPFDSSHIIPAGTLMQIVSVVNNQEDQAQQNYWVYLKVAKERGQVSIFNEKTHALIIPEYIRSKDDLKKYLANFLSKQDPHTWLLSARTYIQEAIWKKHPVIGMNKRELTAAMGPARKKHDQKNPNTDAPQELWYYSDYFVLLDNNQVTKVKKLSSAANIAQK
jgi:hypothetical protein